MDKVILFGAGEKGRLFIEHNQYCKKPVEIMAIADNNRALWHTSVAGFEVIPPSDIPKYQYDYVLIKVGGKFISSVKSQISAIVGDDAPISSTSNNGHVGFAHLFLYGRMYPVYAN